MYIIAENFLNANPIIHNLFSNFYFLSSQVKLQAKLLMKNLMKQCHLPMFCKRNQ